MPLPTGKAWELEKKLYQTSTKEWREKRATELGYKTANAYQTCMARSGVLLESRNVPPAQAEELPVINLPDVKLKKYIPINSGRTGDPETQVLHLTDHHAGEVTPSYNESIYESRLDHLFQSTMRITTLHRNMYPVNDLVILITGDMVHGENPYQGAKVGTIVKGASDQIFSIALPKLTEFILSLQQQFKSIKVYCVRGNHGRYSREAPATSNWDMMLYHSLKNNLDRYNIVTDVSNDFYQMVDIQGLRFFCFHGDQFKATMGIPWFAMTKGLQSWYVTYGGFDFAVCGHFHSDHHMRLNSKSKLFMGASMVTDDPFTLEVVKTSSIPSQWSFGVHKTKGVTWSYSLVVEDKYFPNGKLVL